MLPLLLLSLLLSCWLLPWLVLAIVLSCIQLGNCSRCVNISPVAHIWSSCVNALALSSYIRQWTGWPNNWCTSLLTCGSGLEKDDDDAALPLPLTATLTRTDCRRASGNEDWESKSSEEEEAEVCRVRLPLAPYKPPWTSSYRYFSMCANVRFTLVMIPCSFTYRVAIYYKSDTMLFWTDILWCNRPG